MLRARTTTKIDGRPSVLIVSAAMGAGHDGVAYELEKRLLARGAHAEVVDYLELLPGRMGPFYRSIYQGQLTHAPGSYEWLYGKIDRGVLSHVARYLGQLGRFKVRRMVEHGKHDLVLTTYPMSVQALGILRRKGQLRVPAVSFLTDVDVHGLWLHRGIDRNLTVWEGSAVRAQTRIGTPSHAVGPVLPDVFREPVTAAERTESRARLGITDPDATLVLVVAGSWGVGAVADTARAIVASGVGIPVVLCGNNEQLRAELDRDDIGIALGWTKDVRAVLAASDALVHNAGGLSCLEGFAVGVPVIGHACLPGHGHRNAEAMRDAGVAAMALSTEDLIRELRRLAGTAEGAAMVARARALFLSDPTDELLALAGDPTAIRVPAPRPAVTWAKRVAAVSVAVPMTMGGLSFGVAEATVHGFGVAEGHTAVYVAALVDHAQTQDPAVVSALRVTNVSAAVGASVNSPSATDIAVLRSADVTIVGADEGVHSRNPRRQQADINAAARAVAATGEAHAKVICLRNPSVVAHLVGWYHNVQIALPRVVAGGAPIPDLEPGYQVVLDERGRSTAQILADLSAVTTAARLEKLPQKPMRALWPKA